MSARSRIATRRAAAELAGHRRRLLECAVDSADLDPADALLLRVEPAAHEAGLLRVAQAALAVAEDSHLTQLKSPASDSRPPELGHSATPCTEVTPTTERTGHRAGESAAHPIASRKGEGSTPSSRRKSPSAPYKPTGPTRAAVTQLKSPASDSRPPEPGLGHNGIPATAGIQAPAAARPATDLRLALSPGSRFAGREGEGQAPSASFVGQPGGAVGDPS